MKTNIISNDKTIKEIIKDTVGSQTLGPLAHCCLQRTCVAWLVFTNMISNDYKNETNENEYKI